MTQNNYKVAITGGIASGKSEVAKMIASMGYNVISCDKIYSEIITNVAFIATLKNEFGDIVDTNGAIDRSKLSSIVFSDESKLKKLNDLTHPQIMRKALSKMQGNGIHFCEVPLLFEGGFEKLFDKVIVVLRDTNLRKTSIMGRNGLSEIEAQKRINSQVNYDNSDFKQYYVIHNDGNLTNLATKTQNLIKKIEIELV